ncbi:MAG: DUF6515 family protein [Ginsengibacter sp.]
MKNINILILLLVFSGGLFFNADAQRRENGSGQRDNRQQTVSQPRVERAPQRTFNSPARSERVNTNNNPAPRIESRNTSEIRNNNRISSQPERNTTRANTNSSRIDRVTSVNNTTVPRNDRQTANSNRDNLTRVNTERIQPVAIESQRNNSTARVFPRSTGNADQQRRYDRYPSRGNNNYRSNNNTYNNSYRNNTYNRNYYYRTGYNRRIYVMSGPRYNYRPYNCTSIYFGSYPYYYSSGLFYDYYDGYYQPIFPPFGIRISTLPFGYNRIYVGLNPFYYYNGIFYRNYENNYEVVDAPMGATVSSLPTGAKSVTINGERFYELNGTYFKEDRNAKGKLIYVVVGKNGEVNNTSEENDDNSYNPQSSQLQTGDLVPQLPEGSKVITLNGEKMYVAPDDTYLKEEVNGDTVQYRVVGK